MAGSMTASKIRRTSIIVPTAAGARPKMSV